MGKIKTFEEFMNENSIKETAYDKNVDPRTYTNKNALSPKMQGDLNKVFHQLGAEMIAFHGDGDPMHTTKGYLTEALDYIGGNINRAMNGSEFYNTLGQMSQSIATGGDFTTNESEMDKYKSCKEQLTKYLDECHDAMLEAFTKKINEAKKQNATTAGIIANKYKVK